MQPFVDSLGMIAALQACFLIVFACSLLPLCNATTTSKETVHQVNKSNSIQLDETHFESSTYTYSFISTSKLPSALLVNFQYQAPAFNFSTDLSFSFTVQRKNEIDGPKYSFQFPIVSDNVNIENATIEMIAPFGLFNIDIPNQIQVRVGDLDFIKFNQSLKHESVFGYQVSSIDSLILNLNLTQIFIESNSTSFAIQFDLGNRQAREIPLGEWATVPHASSYIIYEENRQQFTEIEFIEGPVGLKDPKMPKFRIQHMNRVRVEDIDLPYTKNSSWEYTIVRSFMFFESNIFYSNLLSSFIRYNYLDSIDGKFVDIYGRNVTIDLNTLSCGARVKQGYKYGDKIRDYSFTENRGDDYSQCDYGTFFNNSLIIFYGRVLNGPLPPPPPMHSISSSSPVPNPSMTPNNSKTEDDQLALIIGISVGSGLFGLIVVVSILSIVACILVKRKRVNYRPIQ